MPLYASLAVPEVWRYRAGSGKLWFGLLAGGRFHPIDRGLSLPMLTTAIVRDLLANARQAPDDMSWDEQTRAWLRGTLKPAYEASL